MAKTPSSKRSSLPSRLSDVSRPHGSEHRMHKRYAKNLAVRISRPDPKNKQAVAFAAHVDTRDISVGGVFLKSTFFLKPGMDLNVEIDLPEMDRTIKAVGQVARIDDGPNEGSSGFAIRFTEFVDDSEIYLRAFLTQGDMFAFVDEYGTKLFKQVNGAMRQRLVELIVRWEIYQEGLSQKQTR